jgi:NAD(P)H-dependent flavin oxidoreductase YrpB (nitropropane dioxygenase family)
MDRLPTALCDLPGIRYPVLRSRMGSVAGPDLAAEVSRAGVFGVVEPLVREARAALLGLGERVQLG